VIDVELNIENLKRKIPTLFSLSLLIHLSLVKNIFLCYILGLLFVKFDVNQLSSTKLLSEPEPHPHHPGAIKQGGIAFKGIVSQNVGLVVKVIAS
jgi:hypothetical protein